MDSSIRILLHSCLEENDSGSVTEPYQKLKNESEGKSNVGTDLYVLCAEAACQHQKFDVAEDCIKMFFKQSPPGNQYLCRAYMCQAQLNAPTSTRNPAQIEKAVHYLLKAINFAKQNSRYHFLVYNASVLYWQFCRPFLKPNYKRFLAKTLHQVVKALDDIDDEDYEWRAQLMITLIECHIDAGRKDDASQVASTASQFTRSNVPNLYKNILRLQIQYKLTEYGKLSKETKGSPDLHLFFKIHRLKGQLESERKVDVAQDLLKFHKSLTGMCESNISGTSTDFSERSNTANVSRTATPVPMETVERLKLLLELAKLCMAQGLCKLASDSLDYIARQNKDPATNLEVGFLRCELMVKVLGDKQASYSQAVVQVRLQALEKLEQYFMNALRYGDPQVIQAGCTTMWNLCLPLLQPNLRYHVRRPLSLVADALESIDSLFASLRCQIHTELAKCEEDEEQLELALSHLRKALLLDDDGLYSEKLETSLTRLQLRSTLYTSPERAEDVAAMIIEQARTSKDSGTSKMKRASLVKAGNALAPDVFALVLESESESREPSKQPPTVLSKLAARAEHFEKSISKAAGHLKRLGSQNDQERVRIWADLTKTARKQQIWDVVRVAARFCLLYDDGRWPTKKDRNVVEDEGGPVEEERITEGRSSSGAASKKGDVQSKRTPEVSDEVKSHVESDLLRVLAEINLINAEAIVQFLKCQGVQLCDKPSPPAPETGNSPSRKPTGAVEDSPEWTTYCDWISSLSQAAVQGFQHAAELGNELRETWLVCNSAVYLLNYSTHLVAQNRHRELVPILIPVLQNMKTAGQSREATLLCQVSNVLATGLMQPWYPTPSKMSVAISPVKKDAGKKDKSAGKTAPKVTTSGFEPDALADLKQALEHLDYALLVTNGNDPRNLVSISARHPIIKSWVHCKQLLSQQIPKNLGHDSDNPLGQGPMSRCLCAVEMVSAHLHGLADFSSAPGLQEIARMVGSCIWSDDFVALEMWSRLAVLASNADNHQLVMECGQKAMAFVDCSTHKKETKGKKMTSAVEYKEKLKQQLLYYASVVMGQSLIKNMKGQTEIRRDALIHFVNACRFGEMAKSYELVLAAARHYWNNVLALVGEPMERQLLHEPLEVVLRCVAAVAENNIGKDEEDDDEDDTTGTASKTGKNVKNKEKKSKEKQDKKKTAERKTRSGKVKEDPKSIKMSKSPSKTDDMKGVVDLERVTSPSVNVYDEDLKMRAAMYGVLFQAYADKGEWEQGLRAMDQAVKEMPRTSHRLLIFKHRVITKSILGRNVQFDMGKFKNESELVISSMWHHVALNSCHPREQLMAYQNAIDVLQDPQSDWQKADYLLEFGEWLFVNEFPVDDATDQLMWAIDILMTKSNEDEEQCTETDDDVICDQQTYRTDVSSMGSLCGARVNAITDVKTLEYLSRVYIMLAQLVGRKSSKFIDYCLLAVACVERIWKVSLVFAGKISHDGVKSGEGSACKKGNKEKPKEHKEVKVDKMSAKICCPSSLIAWATFELPEKFVEYLKCDDSGTMISKTSFVRPVLSVHYLNVLVDDLCSLGYHNLSLPITSLLCCLAQHVIENDLLLKLVHLRTVGICQDLRLIEEAVYHEKAAEEIETDKNERAKSREEIELWKEKQRQVKSEETRLLNSDTLTLLASQSQQQTNSAVGKTNYWAKDKRKISRIERREIWIRQAEIFIKQGHYQTARELLNEANTSALVFEDQHTRAEVLYNLALLAFYESNWQQAISLLQELQTFHGDHAFWLKTVLLLVDAICEKTDRQDVSGRTVDSKAKEKAILVLKQSMATFQRLSEGSPNKASKTDYVLAALEAKLGSVLAEEVVNRTGNDEMSCSLIKACEHLRNSEVSLVQSGYKREAVKVKCERAVLVRRLGVCSSNSAEKRQRYLEALAILKAAVELSNRLLHEVQCISSLKELYNISLPTEREAIEARLSLGELTVEIMIEHTKDERARRNREARKGSVEKLIDEFVRDEPVLTEKEKKWNVVTRTIVEDTVANLNTAFSQCGAVPYFKAKCNLVLGQCFRTLASYLSPDDDPQWSVILDQNTLDPTASTANQKDNRSTSDDEHDDCEDPGAEEAVGGSGNDFKYAAKRAEVARRLKREYEDYLRTLTQAAECLTQCVQLGIKHEYTEIVADASYHLMEILGRHDMSSASLYLALFQSCSMSLSLSSLLKRCQVDSSLSRLAALTRQRELLSNTFLHQEAISSVFASNSQALGEFEAWRRLSISKNHLEISKELSSANTVYIILQHSKDKSFLYAATLDKPRAGLTSAKSTKQAGNVPGSTKAILSRAKVDPQHLDRLLEKFAKFKSDKACELIRQNYLRRQAEEKRKMFSTVDDVQYFDKKNDVLQNDPTVKEKEANLEQQFLSLIEELEVYLDPALELLKPTLSAGSISETVIIFADEFLLRLPLEAISFFNIPQVQCLARDLSLQMHHHRFHSYDASGTDSKNDGKKAGGTGAPGAAGKKGGKGEAIAAASKGHDKKGEKKVAKDQVIPKEGITVDITGLRYIFDPFNDCADKEDGSPEKILNDLVTKYRSLSAKWSGLVGEDHIASVGEWQKMMRESSWFIFYGTQKCLSYLPPSLLVSLSLQDCSLMMILDHVETNESFLRQGAVDATKTSSELALESPFESAALLSLTGVNCIIANQWNCKLKENREKLDKMMTAAIDENKSIGCAFHEFTKSWSSAETCAVDPSSENAKQEEPIPTENSEKSSLKENSNGATVDEEKRQQYGNVALSKNTVLYGIPYFMLNPQKV